MSASARVSPVSSDRVRKVPEFEGNGSEDVMKLFRESMADLPAGVCIITARDQDGMPIGSTLSAVCSLSMSPPMILACFDRSSNTLPAIASRGRSFLLHVLAKGQEEVAGAFASKNSDKFKGIDWQSGWRDLPELPQCMSVIACETADVFPGGDHLIITAHVSTVDAGAGENPLVYCHRGFQTVEQTGGDSS